MHEWCLRSHINAFEIGSILATLIIESHVLLSRNLAGTTEVDLANLLHACNLLLSSEFSREETGRQGNLTVITRNAVFLQLNREKINNTRFHSFTTKLSTSRVTTRPSLLLEDEGEKLGVIVCKSHTHYVNTHRTKLRNSRIALTDRESLRIVEGMARVSIPFFLLN